jgi:four helix bundle protein
MPVFLHEKLDVYRKALDFVVLIDDLVSKLPHTRDYIVLQIRRAAASVVANIAEGTAGQSRATRLHYFRIARGSAAECSAWLYYRETRFGGRS